MKKKITATDFMVQLNANPEWVAMTAQREEDRLKREAESHRLEAPLLADLQKNGFAVRSVWDLVNANKPYLEALPVLLEHLQRPYPVPIKEGIARALAVANAKFGWKIFKKLILTEENERVRDALAIAIGIVADEELINEAIALMKDRRLGPSRILMLRALEKSRLPKAREALLELEADPDMKLEVRKILRRLS